MAIFAYQALTDSGRLMTGTIEAGSPDQARDLLCEMKLQVNSVDKAEKPKPKTAIGRSEFMMFNQQLASITKAGLPIERALRELSNDISSSRMRKLINEIATELEAGISIDQAFEKRQKNFPPLYGKILKAGVETGRLSEMLASLNRHLELQNHTRRIFLEAITYPLIVLILAAFVTSAVCVLIVPHFVGIFDGFGAELPAITEFFLAVSAQVVPFWTIIGVIIAWLVLMNYLLGRAAAGRRLRESVYLKIPIIGPLYHSSILARMAEGMAVMVSAGNNMPDCLRLSTVSSGSEKLIRAGDLLAQQIEQGANLLEAGQFCSVIPRFFLYSVQLGSQRNELQDNLYSLGEMYGEQARSNQNRLQAVLLPMLLIFVGGLVGLMVLSLFMPLVSFISSFGG